MVGRKQKKWILRLSAAALGAALTLVLLELAASLVLHFLKEWTEPKEPPGLGENLLLTGREMETISDPYLIYRPKPNATGDHVQTNRFGLRNGPIEEVPGPDTFRILLLGGSVAWGYTSLSNEDTISFYLEEYLREKAETCALLRGKRVEVLNGAVPGYVAWQEALLFSIYLRPLHPRVVVTLDGANEYCAAIITHRTGVPMLFDEKLKPYLETRPSALGFFRDWIVFRITHTRLYQLARWLTPPITLTQIDPPSPVAVTRAFEEALDLLSEAARSEGTLVVPVLQPMVILPGAKPLTEFERRVKEAYDNDLPGRNQAYAAVYDRFRAMLQKWGKAEPGRFPFDATAVFEKETGVAFTDNCHLTSLGKKVLARRIGDHLLECLD